MTLKRRILHAAEELPLVKNIEGVLKKIQAALVTLVAIMVITLICILIIAIYFLVHLIQGR